MAITAFSNLSITISDGGTVPSLDYLTTKTYVNIGSGNILKISWNTPTATNNAVNSYKVYVLKYDSVSASYKSFYSADIGEVNEFYLKSSLFNSIQESMVAIRVYIEAISAYGAAYNGTSNTVSVNVSKGAGSYRLVESGYTQPVMKRSLAFTKLNAVALVASDGRAITDAAGEQLYIKAATLQDTATGWTLMQEFYAKDSNNTWHSTDISYEVLIDSNGEIVTDSAGAAVYVL